MFIQALFVPHADNSTAGAHCNLFVVLQIMWLN